MSTRKVLVLNGGQIQNLQTGDTLVGPGSDEKSLFASGSNLYQLSLGSGIGSLSFSSGANITLSGGGELLGLPAMPSGATAAVSKAYADSIAAGFDPKASVRVATTGNLSATYDGTNEPTDSVGSTLTAGSNGALVV